MGLSRKEISDRRKKIIEFKNFLYKAYGSHEKAKDFVEELRLIRIDIMNYDILERMIKNERLNKLNIAYRMGITKRLSTPIKMYKAEKNRKGERDWKIEEIKQIAAQTKTSARTINRMLYIFKIWGIDVNKEKNKIGENPYIITDTITFIDCGFFEMIGFFD